MLDAWSDFRQARVKASKRGETTLTVEPLPRTLKEALEVPATSTASPFSVRSVRPRSSCPSTSSTVPLPQNQTYKSVLAWLSSSAVAAAAWRTARAAAACASGRTSAPAGLSERDIPPVDCVTSPCVTLVLAPPPSPATDVPSVPAEGTTRLLLVCTMGLSIEVSFAVVDNALADLLYTEAKLLIGVKAILLELSPAELANWIVSASSSANCFALWAWAVAI